jgi:hypothetical protein
MVDGALPIIESFTAVELESKTQILIEWKERRGVA